jgi:hypothetical protein
MQSENFRNALWLALTPVSAARVESLVEPQAAAPTARLATAQPTAAAPNGGRRCCVFSAVVSKFPIPGSTGAVRVVVRNDE